MMFAIYSIGPAPWGDDYRFVEAFDYLDDAKKVLTVLESVNINFNYYRIVDWREPKTKKVKLQFYNKRKGTVTGRLSCKDPNLSNVPKTNPRVVSIVDPYKGVVKL